MLRPTLAESLFVATVAVAAAVGTVAALPVGQFLWLVVLYTLALLAVSAVVVRLLGLDPRLGRMMAGVALTFVVYGGLNSLFVTLGERAIDAQLRWAEEAVFGKTLVELVAPHASAGGALFFAIVYSVHVPLFFVPAILHWRSGRFRRAQSYELAVTLAMYIGFVGYVLWPAYGPVGAMPELPPMERNAITQLVAAEGVALGTFPSLHGAISAAAAIEGWRTSRRWGIAFTAVAALVWTSTIYLRYHWVPDLIAGLLLAALALWLAPRLERCYEAMWLVLARRPAWIDDGRPRPGRRAIRRPDPGEAT